MSDLIIEKDTELKVSKSKFAPNKLDANIFIIMLAVVIFIVIYETLVVANSETIKDYFKAETLFDYPYWISLGSKTAAMVYLSVVFRNYTEGTEDKSWRYIAILAFSLVGSVGVSIITSDNAFSNPILLALSISLSHLGYWSWKREHIENSEYQENIKETTNKLEKILNTMPDRGAFKIMADETSDISSMTNFLTVLQENKSTEQDCNDIIIEAQEQLKSALKAMCDISSLWTISEAKLFEANIMISVLASDIQSIPSYQEAFENGKHFFPDLTTLDNVTGACESVLYVLTDIATNSRNGEEADIRPLLLPVNIKSTNNPGSILGAPKAIENKHVFVVKKISDIISNLPPNYVGNQKERIKEYFDKQVNCGSIVSIPFAVQGNDNKKIDAVVNLYRPEEGVIKSPELYESFTRPLVILISQLLYLLIDNEKKSKSAAVLNTKSKDEGDDG